MTKPRLQDRLCWQDGPLLEGVPTTCLMSKGLHDALVVFL